MDHVILTVGRNELPVLVAAYRLCVASPTIPKFSVLYSKQTSAECTRIRQALADRLIQDGRIQKSQDLLWEPDGESFAIDESDPVQIRERIEKFIRQAPLPSKPDYHFHLHHTGGTTAMGVYALQSLLENRNIPGTTNSRYELTSSYLAGKDQQIRDHTGAILTPAGSDERSHWNLTVEELARLHGYKAKCSPEPATPLLELSATMSRILLDHSLSGDYECWLRQSWAKNVLLAWPVLEHKDWPALTAQIAHAMLPHKNWLSQVNRRWQVDANRLSGSEWDHVDHFLHHQCLELLAFRELREALREVYGVDAPQPRHSMTASMPGQKTHEVDVVVVRGYELLIVSCTFDKKNAKRKAFEVIHRARQVGGSHARGIVVCNLSTIEAERTTDELRDDVASPEYHVEIWGEDVIRNPALLRERFQDYLSRHKVQSIASHQGVPLE